MAIVKFSRVISCSSEDPKYPAKNLMKLDVSGRWKCKDPGEKQAVVILEFEKACKIQTIDIGNENSAFIEIFVGKSAVPDAYEVLRVASLLMSVQDAKNEKNKNAVRFFKRDEFSKPAVDQEWDRIKITCNQPYNKNVQYGLSFVRVHSTSETGNNDEPSSGMKTETSATEQNTVDSRLGKFSLKKENDDNNDVTIGSLFARRKDEPLSAAAAIRAASNDPNTLTSPATSKRLSDLIPDAKNAKKKRKTNSDDTLNSDDCRRSTTGPLLYADDLSDDEDDTGQKKHDSSATKENLKNKPNANEDLKQNKPKKDRAKPIVARLSPRTSPVNGGNSQSSKQDQTQTRHKKKPFNRLLDGVVFVISGYQNPYRSDLRSKAVSMGAKYRADWNATCTHLICAFANTPKTAQVRGSGWIIRNSWIEDCHKLRKRLPCVNYKFDRNDPFISPDDEEIWEGPEDDSPVLSPLVERLEVTQLKTGSSSDEPPIVVSRNCTTKEDNVYDADTDVDSDYNNTVVQCDDYENVTLKVLPDLFGEKKFYLGNDLLESTTRMLQRYVLAYKGDVTNDIDESDYIISEDDRYKENLTDTPVLLPDWIWECNDQKKFIPTTRYLL